LNRNKYHYSTYTGEVNLLQLDDLGHLTFSLQYDGRLKILSWIIVVL